MTPLALYRQMLANGVDEAMAYAMAEQFETKRQAEVEDRYNTLLDRLSIDVKAQARREKDRDRKRAITEARKSAESAESAERAETAGKAKDEEPVQDARAPTYARGEDNPSRLVDTGIYHTTPNSADERDWKVRANLEWLDAQLRDAGGPAIASMAIAPGLGDLSIITGLLTGGTGPPCSLDADVLPVVRARCAGRKVGSVRGWNLFRDAIREARDRRLTGAPSVEPVHQGPRHERPDRKSEKRTSREDNYARSFAGSEAAARMRTIGG